MTQPDLVVAPCSLKAARYAVEHWHYSGCLPMPPLVLYGAWEAGRYIGAVLFSRGACRNLMRRYGLDAIEGAELTRVALRDHVAPVSQIVAAAVRRLRQGNPGLRLLVSFADPRQGHHGGIYQALGWVYTGQTPPGRAYQDARGKLHHTRVVAESGWAVQYGKPVRVPKPSDLTLVRLPGKHRYVLPLDRAMRRRVAQLAQPYPRGRSVEGDAPSFRDGEAGSIPADRSVIDADSAQRGDPADRVAAVVTR